MNISFDESSLGMIAAPTQETNLGSIRRCSGTES